MNQIEQYQNGVVKFNFDNGLTVRAQFAGGMVITETVRTSERSGATRLIDKGETFGADAFADYLHEISNRPTKFQPLPREELAAAQEQTQLEQTYVEAESLYMADDDMGGGFSGEPETDASRNV